jgi:hypothetical protein
MTVTLTPHGEELLRAALDRGLGSSPTEIIEHALEAVTGSAEESDRRRRAVENLLAFGEKHRLSLGPGVRIKDLIHEGHKY